MHVMKRVNLGHALDQHPTAKEYLVRLEIKEEPIDQDNECMKGDKITQFAIFRDFCSTFKILNRPLKNLNKVGVFTEKVKVSGK